MSKIIIFDFDGTLTPYPITDFKVLEKCGFIGGGNNKDFQNIVKSNMIDKNISVYDSFYEIIFNVIKSNGYELKDEVFSLDADKIEYNKGVFEFLDYLYKNGVYNYIISSSMKPFLDKVLVSKYFKGIYATTFNYNKDDVVVSIKNLMTDEKKINSIKEIVKDYNYSNVIYIGDGLTDLKAMEYVKNNGGISIYVTNDKNSVSLDEQKYISYIFSKDYSLDSELFKVIKKVLNE